MPDGFGNIVSSGKIQIILTPGTAVGRRLIRAAKDKSPYLDLTAGRTAKAIILMEDGKLTGSAITPGTLAQRIHTLGANGNIEEPTEDFFVRPHFSQPDTSVGNQFVL